MIAIPAAVFAAALSAAAPTPPSAVVAPAAFVLDDALTATRLDRIGSVAMERYFDFDAVISLGAIALAAAAVGAIAAARAKRGDVAAEEAGEERLPVFHTVQADLAEFSEPHSRRAA